MVPASVLYAVTEEKEINKEISIPLCTLLKNKWIYSIHLQNRAGCTPRFFLIQTQALMPLFAKRSSQFIEGINQKFSFMAHEKRKSAMSMTRVESSIGMNFPSQVLPEWTNSYLSSKLCVRCAYHSRELDCKLHMSISTYRFSLCYVQVLLIVFASQFSNAIMMTRYKKRTTIDCTSFECIKISSSRGKKLEKCFMNVDLLDISFNLNSFKLDSTTTTTTTSM